MQVKLKEARFGKAAGAVVAVADYEGGVSSSNGRPSRPKPTPSITTATAAKAEASRVRGRDGAARSPHRSKMKWPTSALPPRT